MRVTMDRAGRVVVPKRVRDTLGLGPEAEFDLVIEGTSLRLDPRLPSERRIIEVDGWPALGAVPGDPLTDDDVRAIRDADQR